MAVSEKELETELLIHELVNAEREKADVLPLVYDKELAVITKNHSKDMVDREFLGHENPDGLMGIDRGNNAGYECILDISKTESYYGISENLHLSGYNLPALTISSEDFAVDAIEGWMNSPDHKERLLEDIATKEGFGVVISGNEVHVTQNIC